jgi:hypothetical protein
MACTALLVLLITHSGIQADTILKNTLLAGYDSFIDRYTILEEDTSDATHDFYAGMANGFTYVGRTSSGSIRNLFKFGNQTIDNNLNGNISLGYWNTVRIDLRSNLFLKYFREGSDYSAGNDYLQSNTYLKFTKNLSDSYRFRVKNRYERVVYDERTYFDYNYSYMDIGLELERGNYAENLVRVAGYLGRKDAPDTTDLGYSRGVAELETQLRTSAMSAFNLTLIGDRRDYRGAVRSAYWNVLTYAGLTIRTLGGYAFRLTGEAELMMFDTSSTTYFDTHFLRGGFRSAIPWNKWLSFYIEPRAAWMLCPDYEVERYWEGTVIIGLDIMKGSSFWLSASYEPGYRSYEAEENDFYSDFYINRLSLIGSVSIPKGFSIDMFVMHDPERHARRTDNFSITLISIMLGFDF